MRARSAPLLIDSQNFRLGAYCTTYLVTLDTIKLSVAKVSNGS
jgi:hypothetical protein